MDDREIAWAGGLWEGEGCFSIRHAPNRNPSKQGWVSANAVIQMTDEDTIRRLARIMDGAGLVARVEGPILHRGNRQPTWRWRLNGFERVQALIAMLWPWLGVRRRGRAVEVLRATWSWPLRPRSTANRCAYGHLLDDPYIYPDGKRSCRVCRRRNIRRWRERLRAEEQSA